MLDCRPKQDIFVTQAKQSEKALSYPSSVCPRVFVHKSNFTVGMYVPYDKTFPIVS